ncbi:MAG TPA: efflux RND transporter periplasmic adaptor subunit [Anaerolineales bacterium]
MPAQRGDLTATVGATGIVHANQSATLAWQTTGTVEQVNVKVGDLVTATQVLAALEQTSLAQNIILAQADLIAAQRALDDLYDTNLSLAQAQQALANAQKAVDDSQSKVDNLGAPAPSPDVSSAQANMVLAKNQLDKAQKAFEPYDNKPENDLIRAMLQNKLATAQKKYDQAVNLYNNLTGKANNTTVSVADANLGLAKAQLADALKKVGQFKAGPDPRDVTTAKTRIAAAQAALDLARIAAPFAGTITNILAMPGDQAAPGSVAFRIDDLSRLEVDVQVSEVDINRIQAGQPVSLTFDAIPGKEYHGKVRDVAPVGTTNQGVVDFTVTVELTDADAAVRPGMTAAVNVIVSQLKNVLLAPNRAVRVVNGQRVVYVMRNGQPASVNVTLGASSDANSEVLQGDLKEGDQIVLNPPTVFQQNGSPGFFGRSR